jgi:hypothetical protein
MFTKEKDQVMKEEFETSPAQGAVGVRFAKGDEEDPFNWRLGKKMRMFLAALAITYVSAFNASANGAASPGFIKSHPGVTDDVFQGSSIFPTMLHEPLI